MKKELENIAAVIFDMDGLMFDTERLVIKSWLNVGKDFNFDISEQIVLETMGLDTRGTEKVVKKHFGDSFPFYKFREIRMKQVMDEIELNGVPVKSGLYELLDLLDKMKILKAVATSTERCRACKLFASAGVEDRFDLIVCGDEIENGKPDPDIFLKAADKLGIPPEKCIVLEDSENGIKAAYRAGMYPVMIPDLKQPTDEIGKITFKIFDSLVEFGKYLSTFQSNTSNNVLA